MYDLESLFGDEDAGSGESSGGSKHTLNQPQQKRPDSGFVGLVNLGATCYLNSMLQMLYMTPELREGIFQLSPEQLDIPKQDELKIQLSTKLDTQEDEFADLPALIDPTPSPPVEYNNNTYNTTTTTTTNTNNNKDNNNKDNTYDIDYSMMEDYLAMGFGEDQVRRALIKFRGRLSSQSDVVDWLISSGDTGEEEEGEEIGEIYPIGMMDESAVDPAVLAQKMMVYKEQSERGIIDSCETTIQPTSKGAFDDVELQEMGSSKTLEKKDEITVEDEKKPEEKKQEEKKDEKKQDGKKRFLYSLQRLFAEMQAADRASLTPDNITSSFGWTGSESLQQHDVHELFRLFFDAIERSLLSVKSSNLVHDLYKGEFVNQIRCLTKDCGYISTRPEDFHDVSVVVKGFESLNDSLDSYVADELLTGDNKYSCERCVTKVDAKRGQKFRSLPPFLMFALQRFEYDWEHDKRIKITSKYSYPLVLDMAPYLDNTQTEDNNSETKGKERNFLTIEDGIIQPAFDTKSEHLYELFAVIVHAGGAYGGHYISLIRNLIPQITPVQNTSNTTPKETENNNTTADTNTEKDENVTSSTSSSSSSSSTPASNFSSTSSSSTSSSSTSTQENKPYSIDELLKQQWYEFDDTRVSPVHAGAVASQYGGSRCAYMLAYRKVSHTLSRPSPVPMVPAHLQSQIEKSNSALIVERENYDKSHDAALYKVNLQVRFLKDFEARDGGLVEKEHKEKEGETKQEGESEEEEMTIEADFRETVAELKKRIITQYSNDSPSEGKVVLQEITSRSGWLRLGLPLKDISTVKLAGLRDGAKIIVWEGSEAAGINVEGPPITVEGLYFYGRNEEPIEFQVSVPELCTLKKLKEAVAAKVEIAEDDMSLCRVGAQEVEMLQMPDNTLLPDAKISDKSTITVEHLSTGAPSYAMDHLNKMVEIFFLDETVGTRSTRPVSIRIEKEATVIDLKKKILSVLGSDVSPDNCRIRRTQSLMQPGTVIGNEKNSISAVGIQGGQLLILELGQVTNTDLVNIRFLVDHAGYARTPYVIKVSKRTSISECKTKMLEQLESSVSASNSRLRKTDAFDTASDVIFDEFRSLDEVGIRNDDLVVLEIGKAASKGAISLHAHLFLPPSLSTKADQSTPADSDLNSSVVKDETEALLSCKSSNSKPATPKSLADELANGLASALTNSPLLKQPTTPFSPTSLSSPSSSPDFFNLLQGDLIPSSLLSSHSMSTSSSALSPLHSSPSILSAIPPSLLSTSLLSPSNSSGLPGSANSSTPTTPTTPTLLLGPDSTSVSPSISFTTPSPLSEAVSSSSSCQAPNTPLPNSLRLHSAPAIQERESEHTTNDVSSFSPALCAQYTLTKRRSNTGNIRIDDIDVDYLKTTVDELKQKLHSLEMLSSVPTHQHLRVWFKEKLLKNSSSVLKKYNITYDAPIVVQTLSTPDPEDTILLYLHQINTSLVSSSSSSSSNSSSNSSSTSNSNVSSIPASSTVTTPPVEIFVPLLQTTSMIRDYVARALDIPKESVAIAKYAVSNKIPSWKVIVSEDEDNIPSSLSSVSAENSATQEDKETGLLPPVLGPHSLEASRRGRHSLKRAHAGNSNRVIVKDGDVIGVLDTRNCPEGIDYFKKFPPAGSSLRRPSPLSFFSTVSSSSHSSSSKPRAQEAVLKINLDWD